MRSPTNLIKACRVSSQDYVNVIFAMEGRQSCNPAGFRSTKCELQTFTQNNESKLTADLQFSIFVRQIQMIDWLRHGGRKTSVHARGRDALHRDMMTCHTLLQAREFNWCYWALLWLWFCINKSGNHRVVSSQANAMGNCSCVLKHD